MLTKRRGAAAGGWALLLALGLGGLSASVQAATPDKEPELTTAEHVNRVKDRRAHAQDRVESVKKLASLRTAQEVRDQRIVEALLAVASAKDDDLFVRMAALEALAELQFNLFAADGFAKGRYTIGFINLLRDNQEEELIRATVAKVFEKTLNASDLQDQQAVTAMLDLAEDKNAPLMLRIACIVASGTIGSPKCINSFSNILAQADLDSLLKENSLRGFARALSKLSTDKVDIPVPTLNRLTEIVFGRDTPVEIRAQGLIALARLKKLGVRGLGDILPKITAILKKEENADLVVAAVESLGILDDDTGLPGLLAAYTDFLDKANVTRENDVKIRLAIVKALGGLLESENARRSVNAAAVRQMVDLLLAILDPEAEPKEAPKITTSAIFSLRYVYPKRPEFAAYHQKAAQRLILMLRKAGETGEAKDTIVDALTTITRMPFEGNLERWEKWYDQAYPAFKLPKAE